MTTSAPGNLVISRSKLGRGKKLADLAVAALILTELFWVGAVALLLFLVVLSGDLLMLGPIIGAIFISVANLVAIWGLRHCRLAEARQVGFAAELCMAAAILWAAEGGGILALLLAVLYFSAAALIFANFSYFKA